MATDALWEALPPVDEQTPLGETVKIRWRGNARWRVFTSLQSALESDWPERALAIRCLKREKTNVVIETVEEREALLAELETLNSPIDWGPDIGYTNNGLHSLRRVIDEVNKSVADVEASPEAAD